jgi:hypothetical protein
MMKQITHSDYLAMREGAAVLERDRLGDKVLLLEDGSFVKLFRRKRLISSAAWYPYAQRFADNANALRLRHIPCPKVIDVFRIPSIERDGVHYLPLEGETLRQVIARNPDDSKRAALREAFNALVRRLHDAGIYFRSLHLGNVVLTPKGELGLIDIADIRFHRKPLNQFWRKRNLRRMEGIPTEQAWLDRSYLLNNRTRATERGN